ncbi:DUF2071 domain-containing protein [Solirubrum puertoriconensis]|uniref:DUF2071 domain-containing protein n=1 Tax=Solirubrum puertoriconensis TaxID=1751427 RepID=A0A9X0L465_SOLP1|nr:DUF2071 domain-containing protein [Solirubrum puertoriconensis]KUG07268.1 hypothetical protein ASU33_12945 [Solirubrum puertoriconensis]
MQWLKHHPFAVEAVLARTTVLTYAVPAPELQRLLPPCLTLDNLGQCGFVAVAMVQTNSLRPKGLPAWLGQSFFLIGYRIFVRYTSAASKRLRGLYILKSETDKRQMALLGDVFTSYRYSTIDIQEQTTSAGQLITSAQANLHIETATEFDGPDLPGSSPFTSWAQARRFAGPLPFTFSYHPTQQQVVIVQGLREEWKPQPVAVRAARIGFLEELGFSELRLASAFTMSDIPYEWQKGRAELWKA